MKKYLMKFMALSMAALLSIGMLAGCGSSQEDETSTEKQAETTQVPEGNQEKTPQDDAQQ